MEQSELYKIMYISSASSLMNEQELNKLLEKCRYKNAHFEITGYLLYHEGNIIQLLEGRKVSVEYIYNTIKLDSRHKRLIELCAEPIQTRMFPDWEMGFQNLSKQRIAEIRNAHQIFDNEMSTSEIDRMCRRVQLFFETFVRGLGLNDFQRLSDTMLKL